jgi:hypothetical protein
MNDFHSEDTQYPNRNMVLECNEEYLPLYLVGTKIFSTARSKHCSILFNIIKMMNG